METTKHIKLEPYKSEGGLFIRTKTTNQYMLENFTGIIRYKDGFGDSQVLDLLNSSVTIVEVERC